jgi:regulator of protease activity HflC (stomatin/prohibitin superfamily)
MSSTPIATPSIATIESLTKVGCMHSVYDAVLDEFLVANPEAAARVTARLTAEKEKKAAEKAEAEAARAAKQAEADAARVIKHARHDALVKKVCAALDTIGDASPIELYNALVDSAMLVYASKADADGSYAVRAERCITESNARTESLRASNAPTAVATMSD